MNKQKLMIGYRDNRSLSSHQIHNNNSGNKDINTKFNTSLMNNSAKAAGGYLALVELFVLAR